MRNVAMTMSLWVLMVGCGDKSASGGKAGAPQSGGAEVKKVAGAGTGAKAVEPPKAVTALGQAGKPKSSDGKAAEPRIEIIADISEAQVNTLLETWVKAQNVGDFEMYAALYADKIVGIKRSGQTTRSFQRKGWLRDRKRMFGKRMSVQIEQVEMYRTAETAVVHFKQSWSSGRYKDEGPKQLVVVRQGGGVKIAREEMLKSVVKDGLVKGELPTAGSFHFVIQQGATYMVLDAAPKSAWADGKRLRLLSANQYASATSPALLDKLPKEHRQWQGKTVQLFGPRGAVCRAQVVSLEVMSRVRPHFGTVQYWSGADGAKPSDEVITREAWQLGDVGRVLVGRVIAMQGNDCRSATWGRDADMEEPSLLVSESVDPMLAARALKAFRKLKGYKTVTKTYVEEVEMPRALEWDRYQGASPKVSMLSSSDGANRFIAVSADAGDGCGEFHGEFWALWRVVGAGRKGRLQLLSDESSPGRLFLPRGGMDINGDGQFEFLGTDSLVRPAGALLRESISVEVPSLDCPC